MHTAKHELFPFPLTAEITAGGVSDLVVAVLEESERQVQEKDLKEEAQREEFLMACDALNCWRMYLRLVEETKREPLDEDTQAIFQELCRRVAKRRKYTADDFESALGATHERTRLPWGFNSLRLAFGRAQRNPIRLLKKELAEATLPTLIAGIALELTQMQKGNDPILLPVDNLRALLAQRKLVVGGALLRLIQAGLLEQTSKRHGTGRAREFKFRGVKGKDYVYVNAPVDESVDD